MPSVAEAVTAPRQLQSVLDAGVENLSVRQTVTFTLYTRITVSQDGFLFWVPSGQTLTVLGSLHYSTDLLQDEDQTVAENRVILTSEAEITEFNLTASGQLWLGSWPVAQGDATLRVAFSSRGDYYGPANLWHYRGIAVLPPMSAQIIASPSDLPSGPIVSNSLPFWLLQNSFAPVYPSFLVPENVVPPYVVAHIDPDATEALQAFPLLQGWPNPIPIPIQPTLYELTSQQLCADRVRLTLYGFNNQTAQQFLVSLIEYSANTDNYGFMSSPAIRDAKRTQREITAIAQKKVIDLRVSYYQTAADVIARRLIVQAIVNIPPWPTNNDGVLQIPFDAGWPTSPLDLNAGALWNDGGVAAIAGTTSPNPTAPPVILYALNTAQLLALGGMNMPLTKPNVVGQLWNNGGIISVA